MPQEHYVLKCFSCETFQAHIVKKAKKWECKICGAKQSFKRNYGKGSGADCRRQVMKLNELRLTNKNNPNKTTCGLTEDLTDSNPSEEYLNVKKPLISKWDAYLEADSERDFLSDIVKEKEEKIPANETNDFGLTLHLEQSHFHKKRKSLTSTESKTGIYKEEKIKNDFNIFESDFSDLDNVFH